MSPGSISNLLIIWGAVPNGFFSVEKVGQPKGRCVYAIKVFTVQVVTVQNALNLE